MTSINRSDSPHPVRHPSRCPREVPSAARGSARRRRVEGGRQRAVKIRLTDAEYEALVARAIDARVSIQRYLIAAALARKPSALQAPSSVIAELGALRRLTGNLANNINQIARKLNSGDVPDASITPALASVTRATRRLDAALAWLMTAQNLPQPGPDPPIRGDPGSFRDADDQR